MPLRTIALGAVTAVAAHAAYISYDLLARRYTGHRLGMGRTAAVAGVCFAFNLNLGALVGGVALRYRLYGRFGLKASVITRILGFSLLTNWIGYSALAGAAFASGLVDLPDDAPISSAALRAFGVVLLLLAAAYLAACRWSRRRRWNVRGHTIELPRARMAAVQITASVTHWSLVATVLYVLLQGKVGFVTVLGALLLSSVAGVITHIPGRTRCARGRVSVFIGRRASDQSTARGVARIPSGVLSGATDSCRARLRCARIGGAPPPCAHLRAIGCAATFGDGAALTDAHSPSIHNDRSSTAEGRRPSQLTIERGAARPH